MDTGTASLGRSESSAPLLPNRDLQLPPSPNPADRIDDNGAIGASDPPAANEGTPPITPSAGCVQAKPEPPQSLASLMIRGVAADYLVTLPDAYDGSAPVPLILGFHGRVRTYLDVVQVDATEISSTRHTRSCSRATAWIARTCLPPATARAASSRILWAAVYGKRLRSIGVMAGTLLESDCTCYVAAVMIHSPRDSVVDYSRGVSARDFWLTRNACGQDTLPCPEGPCVTYQGCEPRLPVAWCEHDEPTYDDTNHGWPSFAIPTSSSRCRDRRDVVVRRDLGDA